MQNTRREAFPEQCLSEGLGSMVEQAAEVKDAAQSSSALSLVGPVPLSSRTVLGKNYLLVSARALLSSNVLFLS